MERRIGLAPELPKELLFPVVGSTQIFWLLPGQLTLPTEFKSLEGEKILVSLEGVSRDVVLSLKRQT